jgi:hypothetical protein
MPLKNDTEADAETPVRERGDNIIDLAAERLRRRAAPTPQATDGPGEPGDGVQNEPM